MNGKRSAVTLPAGGCQDPPPDMPKGREWTDVQRERWEELWTSPQASQWDESATGTVAALIVYESAVLAGTARAWQAEEMRHSADSLGLTPRAMQHLGWEIG